MLRSCALVVFLALNCLGVAACSRGAGAPEAEARLAARVNGAEIAIEKPGPLNRQAASQALERVIDRELLVQKALAAKLDRDPDVARALDNARRKLLAQAYLERLGGAKVRPDEVRAFYQDNPALFSERRIYRVRQLEIPAALERTDLLKAEAARAADLEDLVLWVTNRGLKYRIASLTEPAEEVPLAQLAELARMREGEIAVFASGAGTSVVQLVHAQEAALPLEQAAPVIEKFLAGRRKLELAAAEVKRLRETASIEYVGEFKRN
ncbi:MAG TPA: EpsD family peptidyl-prolyl cis-trans isomerase [Burkholderiales bacterium]|nr:EpsD family peptidyl-prolyl cis-trans isomerase [Burkholderiales bacterium]